MILTYIVMDTSNLDPPALMCMRCEQDKKGFGSYLTQILMEFPKIWIKRCDLSLDCEFGLLIQSPCYPDIPILSKLGLIPTASEVQNTRKLGPFFMRSRELKLEDAQPTFFLGKPFRRVDLVPWCENTKVTMRSRRRRQRHESGWQAGITEMNEPI